MSIKGNNGLKIACIVGLLLFYLPGKAQKCPLTQEAYQRWRMIEASSLSPKSKWITYRAVYPGRSVFEQDDRKPELMVYNTENGRSFGLKDVYNASVLNEDKWLFYKVQGIPGDTLRRDSLIFMDLQTGRKMLWDRPYPCFELYKTNYMAWEEPLGNLKRLCLWDIVKGDTIKMDSINYYSFAQQGKYIVYIKGEKSEKRLYVGKPGGKQQLIFGGESGWLDNYVLDEPNGGTFTVATDSTRLQTPDLLYSFSLTEGKYSLICDWKKVELPEGYELSQWLYLPENGRKYIYPRLKLKHQQAERETEKADFQLQLWKWDAEMLPTRYNPLLAGSFISQYVYNLQNQKWILLSDRNSRQLIFSPYKNSDYVFVREILPAYRRQMDWKEVEYGDLYLKSLCDGTERLMIKETTEKPVWSPDGKYAIIYRADKKQWYVLEPGTGRMKVLAGDIPYPVYQTDFDKPQDAPACGFAAWVKGKEEVILYDEFDLWVADLSGKRKTYCLTREYGRKNHRELRLNLFGDDVNKAAKGVYEVDLKKNVLLRSFDVQTKAKGFYMLTFKGKVEKKMEGPYTYSLSDYSSDGKKCLWIRENYRESPDIWYGNADFSDSVRVSYINAQQEDYTWGNVKLVRWTTFQGKQNEGLLFLPEEYDSSKTYPMIVTFYERQSKELNIYRYPHLSNTILDIPTYVSNGYVVFIPDITYTTPGEPGEDCYDAVVSGTEMLIEQGIADSDRIGLQGHSWGGFQVIYLATRTSLFRCVQAYAAVVNMVSAYTGMRSDGTPRMYMYEQTQSRVGKSLWEAPERYLKYSSILKADRIQSPVLIAHNDEDGAVPFAQGRDLFLALRRLEKPAWLLNYQGEEHVLGNPAAMQDWTIRMRQFFDYYLKDAPLPLWMKN